MRDLSSKTIHIGPGVGRAVRMAGAQLITRKVSSKQTGGAYSLFEVAVRPGGGPTPHIQHREDECFYVLEGRFEFLFEGSRLEAGPGSLIYIPMGNLHAFKNIGEATARLLMSQTPGGSHERFIEETGEPAIEQATSPVKQEVLDTERLFAIGAEYGVEIVSTASLADTGAHEETSKKKPEQRGEKR